MEKKKIVKTLRENGDGTSYLEFSDDDLRVLDLKKGDSVEWMMIDDGEVWKKVTKNKWCI